VFAVAAAIRAFTEEGDAILIQQPVYYPFGQVIENNHRKLVSSPLKQNQGHYEMDFEDFEDKIIKEQVKLFILCSPHNPVGRVWEEWELRKVGDICKKHGVLVISDEIHNDFVWEDHRHTVFVSLSPEYEDMTITCTAPSKTFNLAGLQISNIFIPNPQLKRKFKKEIAATGYEEIGLMGLVACQAAYEGGEEWLRELKEYIWNNYLFLEKYLAEKIPQLQPVRPEGTYLAWIDCRGLGLTETEREELIVKKAGLWLDSGAMFGKEGEGFERMNLACPRKTLEAALQRLENAINTL
ncbi:MAG: pyridoxal phosphate-dependent aminotransferase, partial [Eubacterium sp.]|nr:pyridoxal phosphate-dependent aminotransferase [Eubacterium sp.]